MVGDRPLLKTLPPRTALILKDSTIVSVEAGDPKTVAMAIETSGRTRSGSAATVAKDGYFLTAGHIVAYSTR